MSTPNGSVTRVPGMIRLETNWNSLRSPSRGVGIMTSLYRMDRFMLHAHAKAGADEPVMPLASGPRHLEGERDRPTSTHAGRALSTLGKGKRRRASISSSPGRSCVFLCRIRSLGRDTQKEGDRMIAFCPRTRRSGCSNGEDEGEGDCVLGHAILCLWVMAAQAFFSPRIAHVVVSGHE
jgi:hypothetical protein